MGGSSDYGSSFALQTQLNNEEWQNNAMANLQQVFSGYNKDFYNKAAKNYIKANEPQLNQQIKQTKDALGFKLANQGLTKSSAGVKLGDALSRDITVQQQALGQMGQSYADQLRQQITGYENTVAQQIQSSSNPTLALQTGIAGMPAYTAQQTVAGQLPNLFGNFAQQYLLSNLAGGAGSLASASLYASPGGGGSGGGALPSTESIN